MQLMVISNGMMKMKTIKVYIDKFLYDHFWRLSFLPYDIQFMFSFPTKRLVRFTFDRYYGKRFIESKVDKVAHAYAYDSTIDENNLGIVESVYHVETRERFRQILAKFIRQNWR